MGEQTWTKEPWKSRVVPGTFSTRIYGDGVAIAKLYVNSGSPNSVNAARIVACVNAMRDIDDPAAYVARVKRLVEASSAMDTLLGLPCDCDPRDNYTCASCKWRAALADLATTSKHDTTKKGGT